MSRSNMRNFQQKNANISTLLEELEKKKRDAENLQIAIKTRHHLLV